MAGANIKEIKRRIKSIESTKQITNAMELVATSKLRRAKEKAEQSRPFFNILYSAMSEIVAHTRGLKSIYTKKNEPINSGYVVIAGDRGLAGGYNTNIFKLVNENAKLGSKIFSIGKKADINKYKEGIFHCLDECYKDLYGTVPFTPEMQKQMIDQFTLILNLKYIAVVCDENEDVVAFGLCLPGIGKAVQKSGGRLTIPCLLRLLKTIKKPESVDFALVGIMPKYRNSGLSVFMITILQEMFKNPNLKYMETNLNLETNYNIQMVWKHFDHVQHKRRRSYIKKL